MWEKETYESEHLIFCICVTLNYGEGESFVFFEMRKPYTYFVSTATQHPQYKGIYTIKHKINICYLYFFNIQIFTKEYHEQIGTEV